MRRLSAWLSALFMVVVPAAASHGQRGCAPPPDDLSSPALLDARAAWANAWTPETPKPSNRTPRLRLLGFPTGFLQDPIGVEDDDIGPDAGAPATDGMVLAMGAYNPAFDWHWPGETAGLGYYKFYSQVQLLDLGVSSVSLGLEALRPAGQEVGGLAQGPTLVNPSVAWFHDLGQGAALHGFVGQHIQANGRWNENLNRCLRCGLAWQHPLLFDGDDDPEQGLFFFVQAVGGYDANPDRAGRPPAWDLIPGIHWRVSSNCWMSLGGSRHGLFTCAWQY